LHYCSRTMPFYLEREALVASGVVKEDRIASYLRKLDSLHQQFIREMRLSHDLLSTAEALFDWLWIKKPARYAPHGHYRLYNVIDSQLSKGIIAVGNCLGLTLLYNCLLRRADIDAQALYVKNAFGIGPHVLTILKAGESMVDIENILPDGFDYKGHLNDLSRTLWGDEELIADLYHSMGNECYEKGDYKGALEHYEKAIALSPHYERAHLNKVIVLDRLHMKRS